MAVTASTIEGRYQVINRIASGGMGEVFRAHDAVLGREVAVKILHPQLAGDRGFVDRFRREARAAAILNHPNIVDVYDWGSTDGTYFMVMEFVAGTNLRTLLHEYGPLEPAQVVEVATEILAALDHAHGHGIVHRDVKPENILIARDGTVKVADFGLARAYADSFVSQAEGTVTGTVQYLAPEQIQGEPADPRTDLYALGVLMFELLTGQPPFGGETSLAIAYAHLSGRVPAPSTESPGTPPALDRVVLALTEKERAKRPASARAVREELMRIAPTLEPAPSIRDVASQVPALDVVAEDRASTVTIPRAVSPKRKRRRRLRFAFSFLAVLLVLGGAAWAGWTYLVPHYTHVPSVAGLPVKEAAARLQRAGLRVVYGDAEFSHEVPSGDVIRSQPPIGAKVREGSTVTLVPSKGPELLPVPDVRGLTEDEAKQQLADVGFGVRVEREFSDDVAEGKVVRQDPGPQRKLERDERVTIFVSKGPPPVEVPNVSGLPASEATATLETLGLKVEQVEAFSDQVERGLVISTKPPVGDVVPKGTTVTITVSKGPETFPMPDVVGMKREAAMAKLQGLGLKVEVVELGSFFPPDTVVYQYPDAGTTVQQGMTVTIYVTTS